MLSEAWIETVDRFLAPEGRWGDNVNRWYCHADRAGNCPLKRCGGAGMDHEIGRDER